MPVVKPETVIAVLHVAEVNVPVIAVPTAVAVYVVIVAPPLDPGAVHATVTDVALHEGALCPLPHKRTEEALNGASLLPAVSFVRGFFVWVMLSKSIEVSAVAVGRGTTVGVMVAEVVRGVA